MNYSRTSRNAGLLVFGLLTTINICDVNADSWNGSRADKGFVSAHYDPSVASYGYTGFFDAARSNWNGISSKVGVVAAPSLLSGNDRYYVGTTATPDLLGRLTPYKYDANNNVVIAGENDPLWRNSTVAIYDNTMDAGGFTNAQRTGTCIHEVGHSLKMAHPGNGSYRIAPIPSGRTSIMVQGRKDYGVQQYDMDELRFKWGS